MRVETTGTTTVIRMNRPDRRNAVDGPMAAEPGDAFLAFEADSPQRGRGPHRRGRHAGAGATTWSPTGHRASCA